MAQNPAPAASAPVASRSRFGAAAVVALVGVLVTALLAAAAWEAHSANEDRLLHQRTREVGAVLQAAIPSVGTPLTSAALLAEATLGDAKTFRGVMTPIVAAKQPFRSASLWRIGDPAGPLVVVGPVPRLASEPRGRIAALMQRADRAPTFVLNDLLRGQRRLGYAAAAPGTTKGYFVYGEATLSRDRRARVDKNSAFADLGYALFLGPSRRSSQLIASSTGGARLGGRTDSVKVPFGDRSLLVVVEAHKDLGGSLLRALPWIVVVAGLLLTGTSVVTVSLLVRRRRRAEALAVENAALYARERTVAETLQHSLLPSTFPSPPGVEIAAMYSAGGEGIDIGGDWYDVVERDDGSLVVVVGDVSGRGLGAAAVMASLRFAIRAYALDGASPGVILDKLDRLTSVADDGHFATVLCGELDLQRGTMVWASAGHLPPLVVGATAEYAELALGTPVGVPSAGRHRETTQSLPRAGTLFVYTDGLVERRGESLDRGFERLEAAATKAVGTTGVDSLPAVLRTVVSLAIPGGSDDDAALLGVRWTG
ncbi:MAG: PP2C family protein-serine/threonine phosphatase [Acidimicrobiia bacterium]